jgi:hypothetical protein
MPQGDRLRIHADLLDRVIFPPRRKLGQNASHAFVACAVAHKAGVLARGYCRIKQDGNKCALCSYPLKFRRRSNAKR